MSKTKGKRFKLCGAFLRTKNKEETCSSHSFPYHWDPVGKEIKRRNKVLQETGILLEPRHPCEVMPPILSTLKMQKVVYAGMTYEFLTSEI